MIVSFEYWTPRMSRGHMTVDMDIFFPNTQKNVRKLFQIMVPELQPEKVSEAREYLQERTQPEAIDWEMVREQEARYLKEYRYCLEKLREFGKREKGRAEWSSRAKRYKSRARFVMREAEQAQKRSQKEAEQFRKYLEIFEEVQ